MNYEVVELKEKMVAGFTARTSNSDPDMGRIIGSAWQKFFEGGIYKSIPNKVNDNSIGLYTNYENEINGKYDVVICCEILNEKDLPKEIEVRKIEEGKYAKFIVKGNTKEAIAEFWTELWKMDLNRKYTFDFEEYIGSSENSDEEINVYISIN